MHFSIHPETEADAAAIDAVTIAAFRQAEHSSHTEQFIVRALRRAGRLTISLVARTNQDIVGHVAVSPVTISSGAPGWYGLGPVSVLPARQGQGIGTSLIEQALADLRASGAAGCVVLGEPAFYARFGFRAEDSLVLPGVPPEYFQALALTGKVPGGTVAYDAAFEATG